MSYCAQRSLQPGKDKNQGASVMAIFEAKTLDK